MEKDKEKQSTSETEKEVKKVTTGGMEKETVEYRRRELSRLAV